MAPFQGWFSKKCDDISEELSKKIDFVKTKYQHRKNIHVSVLVKRVVEAQFLKNVTIWLSFGLSLSKIFTYRT